LSALFKEWFEHNPRLLGNGISIEMFLSLQDVVASDGNNMYCIIASVNNPCNKVQSFEDNPTSF